MNWGNMPPKTQCERLFILALAHCRVISPQGPPRSESGQQQVGHVRVAPEADRNGAFPANDAKGPPTDSCRVIAPTCTRGSVAAKRSLATPTRVNPAPSDATAGKEHL